MTAAPIPEWAIKTAEDIDLSDVHRGINVHKNIARALIAAHERGKAEGVAQERERHKNTWQPMGAAPKDGKHCILSVPEKDGFIYSVQGAFQDGQWNAVHRDNVAPLAWMPNVLLPDHFKQKPAAAIRKEGE